jgi:hypothetical protein
MMRKLSVASIASNFTKRSGSIASLRATEEEATAEHLMEGYSPRRVDHSSGESKKQSEIDEMMRSRLSVIQDEKENMKEDSLEILTQRKFSPNGSSMGTEHRLATLKVKKNWACDGQRIVTPPLRTSSANSVNQVRNVTPLPTVEDAIMVEKENAAHSKTADTKVTPQKPKKWAKGIGKNKSGVTGGIRNLFR